MSDFHLNQLQKYALSQLLGKSSWASAITLGKRKGTLDALVRRGLALRHEDEPWYRISGRGVELLREWALRGDAERWGLTP
jgi:hypothetical protein